MRGSELARGDAGGSPSRDDAYAHALPGWAQGFGRAGVQPGCVRAIVLVAVAVGMWGVWRWALAEAPDPNGREPWRSRLMW
jgi:hypothetical protein